MQILVPLQVKLAEPVSAVGNIEDWLKKMVAGMQDTIKKIIRKSWEEVNALPVEKFIFNYPAQVSGAAGWPMASFSQAKI